MTNKKYFKILSSLFLVLLLSFYSCNSDKEILDDATPSIPDDEQDIIDTDLSAYDHVEIIFGESVKIINPYGEDSVKISYSGNHVTVNSTADSIKYRVSGTSSDASLKFYSESLFYLTLDGINISSTKGAAINSQSKSRVFLIIADNTVNTLKDAAVYSTPIDEDEKGTVFTEGPLIIAGEGLLNITGNNKHGICSDEYVRVQNGNISVLQASSDAIHAKTAQVEGGNLQLKASSNGIEAQTGFIKISDCVIDVESENDAIKALVQNYIKHIKQ